MKVLIEGLDAFEQKILQTTVKLHERRETKFSLISDKEMVHADVIIVDARDADALAWAEQHASVLNDKVVVWIDGEARQKTHAALKRPVLWVNLPIILTRILDDLSVKEAVGDHAKAATFFQERKPKPHNVRQQDNRKKVLVVDDSLAIRNYLTSLLEAEGYAVQTAEDGEVALALLEKDKQYDGVFMDVLMPGIDGYAACRKIKSMKGGKQIPVIMLTGKGSPFDRIRGKIAGCNAYLIKPVNIDKLQKTLKKYI